MPNLVQIRLGQAGRTCYDSSANESLARTNLNIASGKMHMLRFAFAIVIIGLVAELTSPLLAQQARPQPGKQQLGNQQPGNPQAGPPRTKQVPVVPVEQAIQQGDAQVAQPPFEALQPQEIQYLDQVLAAWEHKTDAIKMYKCEFTRYQFDPGLHPTAHYSQAVGTLKFMEPDKGEYRVEKVESIASQDPVSYRVDPRRPEGEHWICDGEWIHIQDHNEKKATRIQLPPGQRGTGISRSPLPFLFGVNAAEIKQRYWVRPLFPEGVPANQLWLEVFPKRADDAGNYSRVQIILDRSDTLPMGLIVFLPNYTPQQQHREVYQFANRQTNGLLDSIRQAFSQSFIPTRLGSDWEVVEEPYVSPEAQQSTAGNAAQGQQRVASPPMQKPIR